MTHRCLSQTDQSDLMVKKIFAEMAKFQSVSPSEFDGQTSEVLFTSCLCPTFPVNGLVFFVFCCVRGVCFVAVAGLLSLKGASHYLT